MGLFLQNATQLPRSFLIEDGKVRESGRHDAREHRVWSGDGHGCVCSPQSQSAHNISATQILRCAHGRSESLWCMQALTQPVFVKDVALAVNALVKVRLVAMAIPSHSSTNAFLCASTTADNLCSQPHSHPRTTTREDRRSTLPVPTCFRAKRFACDSLESVWACCCSSCYWLPLPRAYNL